MTTRRIVAVALVAASLGGTAAEAKPKPKPWTQTYDVFLPQPWAVAGGLTGCRTAPQGLSKDVRTVTVAGPGKFSAQLSGYVGEWAVEVYDAKGKPLASAQAGTGAQIVVVKHKGAKQSYQVAVCNYAGGPKGTVRLTYAPS